jgi:hypothetical protein
MTDPIQTILNVIYVSLYGRPKTVNFEYNPLWQMTQSEQATIDLNKADRDAVYLDRGVVSVETVQKQLSSDQTYGAIDDDISDQDEVFSDVDDES